MTMYYIQRDAPVDGKIIGLWGNQQTDPDIQYMDAEPLDESDPEVQAFLNPPIQPQSVALSANQFYVMLENDGKLDAFMAAIETVTPTAKKLTCRNQFNNSTSFTWDMALIQTVMSKATVYGPEWETTLGPLWLEAYTTIDTGVTALEGA